MKTSKRILCLSLTTALAVLAQSQGNAPPKLRSAWQTVVNNATTVPGDPCARTFNSYNQPSVNAAGLVAFRARSGQLPGCGSPAHGVYSRQMPGGAVIKILDRNTLVPEPNNLGTTFQEPPAFPRLDLFANVIATRANHQPVWRYTTPAGETRAGTAGIYVTAAGGKLVTGASKLGAVFPVYEVPGAAAGTFFDVFPGAPAVMDGNTIVYKGNYTENGVGRTGVYFRRLAAAPGGGPAITQVIGNSKESKVPGTDIVFGSLAPPSAARGRVVFTALDNEEQPSAGGIYLVDQLTNFPPMKAIVSIGTAVPGEKPTDRFSRLGEGLSFDGRLVTFWGAWGSETRQVLLQCPAEGSRPRREFCLQQHPNGYLTQVPAHQGIFVHDVQTGRTAVVAKTGDDFLDFLFWNFSGFVPGTTEGGDDAEPARWRATAFSAVSGNGAASRTLFKAKRSETEFGIYGTDNPGRRMFYTVVDNLTSGQVFDLAAPADSVVTEMGIERDGFRDGIVAITVSSAVPGAAGEETGWAGIYVSVLPQIP